MCVSSGAHRLGLEVLGALDERLEGGDELVQPLDELRRLLGVGAPARRLALRLPLGLGQRQLAYLLVRVRVRVRVRLGLGLGLG